MANAIDVVHRVLTIPPPWYGVAGQLGWDILLKLRLPWGGVYRVGDIMTRLTYAYGLLFVAVWAVLGTSGCTNTGFGPFPPSTFDPPLPPGVAYFIPNSVPGPNQFQIIVVNTDAEARHLVVVTSDTGEPIERRIMPCGNGRYVADCHASLIRVEAIIFAEDGTYDTVTLTIAPNAGCTQKTVFLAVTEEEITIPGEDGHPTTETVTVYVLTEKVPASVLNCSGFGS